MVGWTDRVEQLYDEVARYPEAGLQIVGAIRMRRDEPDSSEGDGAMSYSITNGDDAFAQAADDTDVHSIDALPGLIDRLGVQDVLIALGSEDHRALIDVLRLCDGKPVSLKLVPRLLYAHRRHGAHRAYLRPAAY